MTATGTSAEPLCVGAGIEQRTRALAGAAVPSARPGGHGGAGRPPPFPLDESISPRRGPLPAPPFVPRAGWCAPLAPPCRHGGTATSPARRRAGREGAGPHRPALQSAARVARRLRQSQSRSVNHALSTGRSGG